MSRQARSNVSPDTLNEFRVVRYSPFQHFRSNQLNQYRGNKQVPGENRGVHRSPVYNCFRGDLSFQTICLCPDSWEHDARNVLPQRRSTMDYKTVLSLEQCMTLHCLAPLTAIHQTFLFPDIAPTPLIVPPTPQIPNPVTEPHLYKQHSLGLFQMNLLVALRTVRQRA